jgi:hypothetical protein
MFFASINEIKSKEKSKEFNKKKLKITKSILAPTLFIENKKKS